MNHGKLDPATLEAICLAVAAAKNDDRRAAVRARGRSASRARPLQEHTPEEVRQMTAALPEQLRSQLPPLTAEPCQDHAFSARGCLRQRCRFAHVGPPKSDAAACACARFALHNASGRTRSTSAAAPRRDFDEPRRRPKRRDDGEPLDWLAAARSHTSAPEGAPHQDNDDDDGAANVKPDVAEVTRDARALEAIAVAARAAAKHLRELNSEFLAAKGRKGTCASSCLGRLARLIATDGRPPSDPAATRIRVPWVA